MLPTLSPQEFVAEWRSAAQEHFIDVCRLVGRQTPAEAELQRRTLTNLYNRRPTWLDLAHRELDHAVLDAYGWPRDLGDEDLLARLLALNLERSLPSRKHPSFLEG